MNPQMMEHAQNMMRNMTPEQMAHMRQMMSQMSPDQMANMQRMAANMGMDSSPGTNPQPSQAAYQLSGARVLKEDGNALHKGGNHADAILKYNQALANLSFQSSAEAMALQTSCELNKAMCHLKLEQWQACEEICTQVLKRGPNLKAHYRRGQAFLALKSFRLAVQDLQHASQLCPLDDTPQQALIGAKLSEAKQCLSEIPNDCFDEPVSYNDGSVTIEEVLPDSHVRTRPAPAGAGTSFGKVNSESARAQLDAMCEMPEEHLRQTAREASMPGIDGNFAKQMAEMMRDMDPQQLNNMMRMSEQLHSSRTGTGCASGDAGATAMDPAVAVDMMRNMSSEQIENMAKAAAGSGMMPPGMDINPELLKQSAEMMKSMSPEDLQRMQEMASATNQDSMLPAQPGVGKKPSSSMGAMWGMADMLKDPKAMKQAMSMMKQMDEEQLANLMKMNQPNMTDEDARRMAQQMKSADDRVLGVLLGGMSALARARAQALSAIQWFLKNPSALFAVVLLVFAVILRYVGIM